MASVAKRKRETVSIKTFRKWPCNDDFDVEVDETGLLELIRCKICTDHFIEIKKEAARRGISGPPLTAIVKYVDGVSYIHKGNTEKHVRSGSLHQWAKDKFSKAPKTTNPVNPPSKSDPRPLMRMITVAAEKNYVYLFNTALSLVLAEKPFTDFPFALNMQKRNGVNLMAGKDDHIACAKFVYYPAEALKADIKSILLSANFFSGEMDGSEARKTKEEKELVYVKVVINGQAVELLLKCQRMTDFGGVDADATKRAFEDAFMQFDVPETKFEKLMISVCADGASINMGRISGACTSLKTTRPWLLIVHCVNHRLELAIGDSFQANESFKRLDEMIVNIYYLFRNSGKNKRIIMRIAQRLSVTWVSFVNSKGTRFQAHHYHGIRVMIVNFLSLLLFAENMLEGTNKTCKPDLKAILKGYHNQWVTYGYLASLELYRRVLRLTSHVSLIMQAKGTLVTDILDSLEECKSGLRDIADSTDTVFPFSVQVNDTEDEATLTVTATNLPAKTQFKQRSKMTEKQLKQADKCIVKVQETFTLKKVKQGQNLVKKIKEDLIPTIAQCIDHRYTSLKEPVVQAMRLADPTAWECDSSEFGKGSLRLLAEHFAVPLSEHKFSLDFALKEMQGVKALKAGKFKTFQGKLNFWEKIFNDYQHKFPHFLLVIELCLCVIFSSSTVERGFSTVKRHLSDSRLSLTNSRLNDLLMVKINTPILSQLDPNYEVKLVQKAVKLYMDCPRGRYHKTSTVHSNVVQQDTSSPDLFLPRPSTSFISSTETENELVQEAANIVGIISDTDSDDQSESSIDTCMSSDSDSDEPNSVSCFLD